MSLNILPLQQRAAVLYFRGFQESAMFFRAASLEAFAVRRSG